MTRLPELDPFAKTKKEKKQAVKLEDKKHKKNEYRQDRSDKIENKDAKDLEVYSRDKKKHNQDQIQKALKNAQKSTGSVGV